MPDILFYSTTTLKIHGNTKCVIGITSMVAYSKHKEICQSAFFSKFYNKKTCYKKLKAFSLSVSRFTMFYYEIRLFCGEETYLLLYYFHMLN